MIIGLAGCLALSPTVQAQQQTTPHLGYLYPAGGRQGTTFQVSIGGRLLDGAFQVHVSGRGIQAKVVEHIKPLTPKQVMNLREKVKMLLALPRDATVFKEIQEIRRKIATFNRNANPNLADTVVVEITIVPKAEPGEREIRLSAASGLSNPLVFQVGQLPEFSKKDSKSREERPVGKPLVRPGGPTIAPAAEQTITLPAIVNGQIMPGEVDHYRFQAHQGQHLVVAASARELLPYLADAVPGWFQAALALYDAKGNELAYDDHYRFHPDPVLFCKIPADGDYVLEIRDALYRGREDFVYRIALGELPFVTSIFPLGGPAGRQTSVKLEGWNLPQTSLIMDARDRGRGNLPLIVRSAGLQSNRVPFALDNLPECLEREPNNQPANAQPVTLPIIVNGHIDAPGDWDVFRFQGRAGQQIVAEVYARRLDSPLDSVLKLTDEAGKQLAFNDDYQDKGAGLHTHHADSLLTATLPAEGTYFLHLGDAQRQGGPAYGYRLRLGEPRPDFELRVVPSSINVRPGTCIPITVYALRRDGFSQEIALALKDAPMGFVLTGARVPANQDQVRLTLTAPLVPQDEPFPLHLEGRARIQGRDVRHSAIPADDLMQAFAYHHLVCATEWMAVLVGKGRPQMRPILLSPEPVKLTAGGTTPVRFVVPRWMVQNRIHLELSDPPEGITIKEVSQTAAGAMVFLQTDAAKVKLGQVGNLIVNAFTERAPAKVPAKPNVNRQRVPVGTLPAIAFEIVGRQQ